MDPLINYITNYKSSENLAVDFISLSDFKAFGTNENLEIVADNYAPYIMSSELTSNQYLFEVLDVLMLSNFLNVSAFPFVSNTQIIHYQCLGDNCSLMAFGLTYLNSRAHGVIANRQGVYDYNYLTNKSHPMPILKADDYSLQHVIDWNELNYGLPETNLLYIDDDINLDSALLSKALRTDNYPYIKTTLPLKHQGSLILKNPKDTLQVYNIARWFNKFALVQPLMARGSWYLLATDLRSEALNYKNGLARVNNYYLNQTNNKSPAPIFDLNMNIHFNLPYYGIYGFI